MRPPSYNLSVILGRKKKRFCDFVQKWVGCIFVVFKKREKQSVFFFLSRGSVELSKEVIRHLAVSNVFVLLSLSVERKLSIQKNKKGCLCHLSLASIASLSFSSSTLLCSSRFSRSIWCIFCSKVIP